LLTIRYNREWPKKEKIPPIPGFKPEVTNGGFLGSPETSFELDSIVYIAEELLTELFSQPLYVL